jgi:S-DNA-T family DNA segregation ATPase FtsK/SpoIIIE
MTDTLPETNGSQPVPPGTVVTATPVPADEVEPEMRAESAQPEPVKATYADVSPTEGALRPVIPENWQTLDGIKAELRRHLHRHWHRARYHGVRSPWYALKTTTYAVLGSVYLVGHIIAWWHAINLTILESQAVAKGSAGHKEAIQAHTQGLKTRKARGSILAVCLVLAIGVFLTMLVFLPVWGWVLFAIAAVLFLSRYGAPNNKPLIQPAVIGSQYEKLSPDIIVRALGSLSIAAIDKVLREGREIGLVTPVVRDGPGYRVALDLPFGVTAGDVTERRDKFASGLRRPLGCVWPEGDEAHEGRLVLYVCDEPLSKARQPAWPLLKAGKADIFAPVPFATDQRVKRVDLPLMFSNLLIGSIPRQGKTVAMRVALLAAALDPIVELRIFELKGTGDLGPLAPVCHAYGSGADDQTIEECLASMRQIHDVELIKRASKIKELSKDRSVCPDSKVTPAICAKRSLGLHPIVFGLDECQEAFSHPEFGAEFAKYALGIIKRGPALGIILILATQRPDAKSLPPGITANAGLRFCLRVMDQVANDMVLGTSSYKRGINATLMTVSDKGCGYLVGAADAAQVAKTYNINGPAAERIAARARAARQQAGRLSGYALGEGGTDARNFLADVLSVFGTDRNLWCETIATRLAAAIPDGYADTTQDAVSSQLRAKGVDVKPVRETGAGTRAGCERSAIVAVCGEILRSDLKVS